MNIRSYTVYILYIYYGVYVYGDMQYLLQGNYYIYIYTVVYIQCIYGICCREITKYTVMRTVYMYDSGQKHYVYGFNGTGQGCSLLGMVRE